jgi:hypothetical protein
MDDLANEQPPEYEDSASDKDGDGCTAAESDEETDVETIPQPDDDLEQEQVSEVGTP